MKYALYSLVVLSLAISGGCATTCCGPCAGGCGGGSVVDTMFGGCCETDSCSAVCGGGCSSVASSCTSIQSDCSGYSGPAYETVSDGGPARFGRGMTAPVISSGRNQIGGGALDYGCPGAGCRGCGRSGCVSGLVGHAVQPALAAAGAVGHVTNTVAHLPKAVQYGCANGTNGQFPGPTSGMVQYPYYTTRGPRDFFMANPPSIGP